MTTNGIHHVAYRCNNAKETVDFYKAALDMELVLAIAEDKVPSTGEPDPYVHVFLDAGENNVLAFFELPNSPTMGKDPNTPDWVQHIAFHVDDFDALLSVKAHLESMGLDVLGPIDHGVFDSIYFHDPNNHRLELSAWKASAEELQRLREVAPVMIAEWDATGKIPTHTQSLHSAT
ncbi:MAG: VOC family protein [Ilumatobacteraceae bacterium]